MKKPSRRTHKKITKNEFEERFGFLVGEYNKAKEILDSMDQDSDEYKNQQKLCDKLFANAERFVNTNS